MTPAGSTSQEAWPGVEPVGLRAVERRKARAPEAQASGNIRSCGAPPHPPMRRCRVLRLSALHLPSLGGSTWESPLQCTSAIPRRGRDLNCVAEIRARETGLLQTNRRLQSYVLCGCGPWPEGLAWLDAWVDSLMTSKRYYNRPPIVEAIIDLKFDGILSDRELRRLRDRFKTNFPAIEEKKNIRVEVNAQGISTKSTPAGFKMTAKNAVDMVLINEDSFGTVRLAPYDRWKNLIRAAKNNFEIVMKAVGRKTVVRLGVRFVNRLDIPSAKIMGRDLAEFVKLDIALPQGIAKERGSHSLAVNLVEVSTGAKVLLQSGEMVPALLDHRSVSLDIDASWDSDISNRIDEMWASVELLRNAKNACFEACITDELRSLFE